MMTPIYRLQLTLWKTSYAILPVATTGPFVTWLMTLIYPRQVGRPFVRWPVSLSLTQSLNLVQISRTKRN